MKATAKITTPIKVVVIIITLKLVSCYANDLIILMVMKSLFFSLLL